MGSPDFNVATLRIQEKVKKHYAKHEQEIAKYKNNDYFLEYIPISDFVENFIK